MRAIGIILAGGNSKRLKELSQRRAVCAMPVAGSYRSIDFALSNMEYSRIQKVAVLAQYNSRSLNEHLASSKWWNFGRKQGGLFLFTPSFADADSNWYRGTADAIAQNINFLKTSHEPYVVIASGDCVYKMDYNKVLSWHVDKRADITVVVKDMPEDWFAPLPEDKMDNAIVSAVAVLNTSRLMDKLDFTGAEAEIRRTGNLAQYFRNRLAEEKLPFEIVSEAMSNAVTPLHPLTASAYDIFLTMKDEYGIWICPNGGEMRDTVFRVGHIGDLKEEDYDVLIDAFLDMHKRGLL